MAELEGTLWTYKQKCRLCQKVFGITERHVEYRDMREEGFFEPDYQFAAICPECGKINIVHPPSQIAVWIQLNRPNLNANPSS